MSEDKEEAVVTNKPPTKKQLAAEKAQAKLDAMVPEGTMVMCDDEKERPVIYRETAIEEEVNRYFTGEKCRNGHMVERKVKGYVCTTCARIRQKERHKKRLASDPNYKEKFAKKRAAKHKTRYAEDPDYKAKVLDKAKDRRARKSEEKHLAKVEEEIKNPTKPSEEKATKASEEKAA